MTYRPSPPQSAHTLLRFQGDLELSIREAKEVALPTLPAKDWLRRMRALVGAENRAREEATVCGVYREALARELEGVFAGDQNGVGTRAVRGKYLHTDIYVHTYVCAFSVDSVKFPDILLVSTPSRKNTGFESKHILFPNTFSCRKHTHTHTHTRLFLLCIFVLKHSPLNDIRCG